MGLKNLYLFRHAKSDWNADYATDFERPLNKRGRRAATRMGEVLGSAGHRPEVVLCSSAVRTRETLRRAATAAGWRPEVVFEDDLYTGNPNAVTDRVRRVRKRVRSVMVVGHETAMSETLARLTGGSRVRFPTAAVACLRLETERWKSLRRDSAALLFLLPPRLVE